MAIELPVETNYNGKWNAARIRVIETETIEAVICLFHCQLAVASPQYMLWVVQIYLAIRLTEMYTRILPVEKKDEILSSFSNNTNLRHYSIWNGSGHTR